MAAITYEQLGAWLLAALVRQQPGATAPFFVTSSADAFFATNFPEAIRYAEGRIYKEVVPLATRIANTTVQTVAGSRLLSLNVMSNQLGSQIINPEQFSLIVPSGSLSAAAGTRVPYLMASLDVINMVWPVEAITVTPSLTDFNPRYWAMLDHQTIAICPTPDNVYAAEITGIYQPTPLSASNTTTYISTYYPELLEACCMVFMTGALLKNFGAKASNPEMAVSWEMEATRLMGLAKNEERRRRGFAPDTSTPGKAAQ